MSERPSGSSHPHDDLRCRARSAGDPEIGRGCSRNPLPGCWERVTGPLIGRHLVPLSKKLCEKKRRMDVGEIARNGRRGGVGTSAEKKLYRAVGWYSNRCDRGLPSSNNGRGNQVSADCIHGRAKVQRAMLQFFEQWDGVRSVPSRCRYWCGQGLGRAWAGAAVSGGVNWRHPTLQWAAGASQAGQVDQPSSLQALSLPHSSFHNRDFPQSTANQRVRICFLLFVLGAFAHQNHLLALDS